MVDWVFVCVLFTVCAFVCVLFAVYMALYMCVGLCVFDCVYPIVCVCCTCMLYVQLYAVYTPPPHTHAPPHNRYVPSAQQPA